MNFYGDVFTKTILSGAILLTTVLGACKSPSDGRDVSDNNAPPNKQPTAIRISAPEANASEPALAADANGNFYAVYVEHRADKSADVYLQKLDLTGNLIGEKTRVNPEKGRARAWFGDAPTIQIGKDQTIYIGWTAKVGDAEKSNANKLYLSVSRDGGASFAAPVQVNDDAAPAAHGMHSLAVAADNLVYLAWLDERNLQTKAATDNYADENLPAAEPEFQFVKAHHNSNQNSATKVEKPTAKLEEAEPNSEIFYAVSGDGGKTFAPNKKLSSEVCPCCKTNLLAAPDGKIYVSWRQVLPGDFRHIAVSTLTDNGNNYSAPVIVSDDKWQISACPVSGAPMAMTAGNNLEIAWFTAGSAGKQGIYWTQSKDGGKTFAPRVLISENAVSGTPVLLSEGGASRIIWAETGKFLTAKLATGKLSEESRREIGEGELPAAMLGNRQTAVAFVKKNGEQRSVWLTFAEK